MKTQVIAPQQQYTRHIYELSVEESVAALKAYIAGKGETIPEGKMCIWEIELQKYPNDRAFRLVVDSPIP